MEDTIRINRCSNCMEEIRQSEQICSHCRYDNKQGNNVFGLKQNTILHGRYLVGVILGKGGFGITYIGYDLLLDVKVAIKEYYPQDYASRDNRNSNSLLWNSSVNTESHEAGKDSFLKEARRMAKLDTIDTIVRIRDTFTENNTAYIVMDYVKGITLKQIVMKSGSMSFKRCADLLLPILKGLVTVHENGVIHRDISPDNIMIKEDGTARLLDLGAAKDITAMNNDATCPVAKRGFSPIEQYSENGALGPWTDIYAICATIYYCVTGTLVPESLSRVASDALPKEPMQKSRLTDKQQAFLRHGLAVNHNSRIQDVRELIREFEAAAGTNGGDGGNKKKPLKTVVLSVAAAFFVLFVILVIAGSSLPDKTYDNGDEYYGEVVNDKPNGKGKMEYANGDVYEGNFLNGLEHGTGKKVFANGDIYEGGFANGNFEGRGEWYRANDGATYTGNYKAGTLVGEATVLFANGGKLVINYVNGTPTGNGDYTFADGRKEIHVYDENGKLVEQIAVPDTPEKPDTPEPSDTKALTNVSSAVNKFINENAANQENISVAVIDNISGDFTGSKYSFKEFYGWGFYLPVYFTYCDMHGYDNTGAMSIMDAEGDCNVNANAAIDAIGGLETLNSHLVEKYSVSATHYGRFFGKPDPDNENYTSAAEAVELVSALNKKGQKELFNFTPSKFNISTPSGADVYAQIGTEDRTKLKNLNLFAVVNGKYSDYCVVILTKNNESDHVTELLSLIHGEMEELSK